VYTKPKDYLERRDVMTQDYIVSLEKFKQKYESQSDLFVLDVREDDEYAFAHVPKSVHIPLGQLEANLSKLPQDKDIYIICRTGNRSDFAAQLLMHYGYKHVFNVVPGMIAWDGPIETGI